MRSGKALRLIAAIVLLGVSLWWAHPAKAWEAARNADWTWIGAALLLVAADRALMAFRSIALLTPILGSDRPPIPALLRVFFVSTYLGTFLPGSVGSDAVRTIALNRLNVPAAHAFASVFIDRFLGILSNLTMALIGLWVAWDLAKDPVVLAGLLGTAIVCGIAAALVFSRNAGGASTGLAQRLPGTSAGRIASTAITGLQRYAHERNLMSVVFAASVLVQILRVLQAYCLGRSLNIPLGMTPYFALIPTILLIILLPTSISGIGSAQFGFILLFERAHVERADAFALSVLFLALGVVGNLPGGLLYATERRPVTKVSP